MHPHTVAETRLETDPQRIAIDQADIHAVTATMLGALAIAAFSI